MKPETENKLWLLVAALFALLFTLTLLSCSKEEENICKECLVTTRYETQGFEMKEDTTFTECNNPQNFYKEEPSTFEYQDSTYTGIKKTNKHCK